MNIYDVDLTAAMRRSQSLAFATTGISMRPMAFFAISGLDVLLAQERKKKFQHLHRIFYTYFRILCLVIVVFYNSSM